MQKYKQNLLLYIFFIFSTFYQANSQGLGYFQFDKNNGFISDEVYAFSQDVDGYIWISTSEGVAKWDGCNFKYFTINDGLPTDDIWLLHSDTLQRVWLVNYYDTRFYIKNDSIHNLQNLQTVSASPHNLILIDQGLAFESEKSNEIVINNTVYRDYSDSLLLSQDFSNYLRKINPVFSNDDTRSIDHLAFINLIDSTEYQINKNKPEILIISPEIGDSLVYIESFDTDNFKWTLPMIFQDSILLDCDKGRLTINLNDLSCHFFENEVSDQFRVNRSLQLKNLTLVATSGNGLVIKPKIINHEFKIDPIGISDLSIIDNRLFVVKNDGSCHLYSDNRNEEIKEDFILENKISLETNQLNGNTTLLFDKYKAYSIHPNNSTLLKEAFDTEDLQVILPSSILKHKNKKFIQGNNKIVSSSDNTAYYLRGISDLVRFQGELYFSSQYGLGIINANKLEESTIVNSTKFIDGLINYRDLFLIIRGKYGRIFSYTPESGIKSIKNLDYDIKDIIIDEQDGKLYVLGDEKLNVIFIDDPLKSFCIDLYVVTGRNKYNSITISKDSIYIGSTYGIAVFSKNDIGPVNTNPSINKLQLTDHNGYNFITSDIPFNSKNINIDFGGFSFSSMNRVSYQYRLKPINSDFTSTEENKVKYTSLASGKYTFEVRLIDAFENKSPIKSIDFSILPPWYLTWQFYLLAVAFCILCSWFYFRQRLKGIKLASIKQNQLSKNWARLELEALRSQMNPHFIFNTLNAIQDLMHSKEVSTAEDYLTKFAYLIRKFLDYSRSNEVELSNEIDLLKLYCELENLRMTNKVDLIWNIGDSDPLEDIKIPTLVLQPIIENAFKHGLFHKLGYRKLEINISQEDNKTYIQIEDNGIGRKQVTKNMEFKSHGMDILNERINTLKSTGSYKIHFETTDLYHSNGTPNGTRVNLIFDKQINGEY